MKPATQQSVINMSTAKIQQAVKKAFAPRRIIRSVAHGRAPMIVNGAAILPASGKS